MYKLQLKAQPLKVPLINLKLQPLKVLQPNKVFPLLRQAHQLPPSKTIQLSRAVRLPVHHLRILNPVLNHQALLKFPLKPALPQALHNHQNPLLM